MTARTELDAESTADRILTGFWMDGDRLSTPVDPIEVAQRLSIYVCEADLPGNTSGMLIKNAGEPATIYLQRRNAEVRRRFSCAHEIGHYVDHAGRDLDGDGIIDDAFGFVDVDEEFAYHRDQLSQQGTDPDERFANQFAAALLMPAWAVHMAQRSHETPAELAATFGVSVESMGYRLKTLDLG